MQRRDLLSTEKAETGSGQMLTVDGLSFSYGRTAVFRQLSFSAAAGECLVVAGPNGSGKSTLLSLLAGVLTPGSGSISANGKCGYVPQGVALFEDMTVRDNLKFFAALSHVSVPESLPFGVQELLPRPLASLSGGMKKRVSITCALLGEPDILLLDEPCAGLDLCYREELTDLLNTLKRQGRTVIYAGHEPAEFSSCYDRLLLLGGEAPAVYTRASITAEGGVFQFLIHAEKELNKNK